MKCANGVENGIDRLSPRKVDIKFPFVKNISVKHNKMMLYLYWRTAYNLYEAWRTLELSFFKSFGRVQLTELAWTVWVHL